MPNRKFYIKYYLNGNLVRQPIRRWAAEHRNIFPEYGFSNSQSDFPITHLIADRLEHRYSFHRIEENEDVVLRNMDTNFRF